MLPPPAYFRSNFWTAAVGSSLDMRMGQPGFGKPAPDKSCVSSTVMFPFLPTTTSMEVHLAFRPMARPWQQLTRMALFSSGTLRTDRSLVESPQSSAISDMSSSPPPVRSYSSAGESGAALFDRRSNGRALWTVKDDMDAVMFAKGGDLVLTSGNDGVHIRRTKDGGLVKTVPVHSADSLSLSPDGTKLLSGAFSSGAALWDVGSGKKLWDLPDVFSSGQMISASGVAIAPDGRSFATAPIDRRMGSWDSTIRVFSADDFSPLQTFEGQTTRLLSIGFDGHLPILVGADTTGGAFLWRGQGRAILLSGHIAPVISAAISPDGKYVALGSLDGTSTVWLATGDERFQFTGHSQYVGSVAFSHNGKSAYSSGGPGFGWSLETGRRTASYGDYDLGSAVLKIVPTGNDAYVVTEAFGKMRLWTPDGSRQPLPKALERPANGTTSSDASLPDISPDGRVVMVDCAGAPPEPLPSGLGFVTECASDIRGVIQGLSKDGNWILSSQDSVAYLRNGATLLSFDQERNVDLMALSDDDSLLLTGSLQDNIVHLWDVQRQTELCRLVITKSGHWVVIDGKGRFDTDDIEGIRGLSWIMPDAPLRPLPLEIFLKEFFTPNLLTRIFRGDLQAGRRAPLSEYGYPKVVFDKIETNPSTGTFKLRLRVKECSCFNQSRRVRLACLPRRTPCGATSG